MTALLNCIQAARRAAKRKAAAQASPAEPRREHAAHQLEERHASARTPPPAPAGLTEDATSAPTTAAAPSAGPRGSNPASPQQHTTTTRRANAPCYGRASTEPAPSGDDLSRLPPSSHVAAALPAFGARDFYGVPRLTAVEMRVQRFLSGVKQRLSTAGHPYQLFPLQAQAFDFADAHDLGDLLRVFAVESGPAGARRFIVSTYAEFWRRYEAAPPLQRHHYEIIRQGAACHLYFDLEYARPANPRLEGDRLVDTVLSLTAELLHSRFGLQLDNRWVLELDSTTERKFSRHLVVPLPGAAFASNAHVGAFVRQLYEIAAARRPDSPAAAELFLRKESGEEDMFIDRAVYTRNRSFRLYLSSKAGKEAVLLPTGRLEPAPRLRRQLFMASLICNVPPSARLLRCCADEEAPEKGPSRRGGGGGGGSAAVRQGPSPFPELESYLAAMVSQGGERGFIRSWVQLPDVGVLLYNIGGNRWCGHVGRAHKSNGIFLVVDTHAALWYQKCYDPDCRHYRSEAMPLPHGALQTRTPAAPRGFDESDREEDTRLLAALESFEAQQAPQAQQAQQAQQATHTAAL